MGCVIKCKCGYAVNAREGMCPFCKRQFAVRQELPFEFEPVVFFNKCETCNFGNGKGEKRRCSVFREMCFKITKNCTVHNKIK